MRAILSAEFFSGFNANTLPIGHPARISRILFYIFKPLRNMIFNSRHCFNIIDIRRCHHIIN